MQRQQQQVQHGRHSPYHCTCPAAVWSIVGCTQLYCVLRGSSSHRVQTRFAVCFAKSICETS
jgi:hypothetical protein